MSHEIDWQHFEACVRAARAVGCDDDEARDVALTTLEELAEAEKVLPLSRIRRRARWRAADRLRAVRRQAVQLQGFDLDSFASNDPTPEQLLAVARAIVEVGEETLRRAQADGDTPAIRQARARARRVLMDAFTEE